MLAMAIVLIPLLIFVRDGHERVKDFLSLTSENAQKTESVHGRKDSDSRQESSTRIDEV